jgi:hypothetical protein
MTNSSFCSNSGCHARDWDYLQIDTPAVLALAVPQPQPAERRLPNIPHPLVAEMDCQTCHGPDKPLAYPENHADYSQEECSDCHRLAPDVLAELEAEGRAPAVAARPAITPTRPPSITHMLVGNADCLACHAVTSNIEPAPATHLGFANDSCQDCHKLASEVAALMASEVAAAATAPPQSAPTIIVTATATLIDSSVTTATIEAPPAVTPTSTSPVATAVTVSPTAEANAMLAATVATGVITATATVTQAVPVAASQLLTIPHALQGNENCLACHAVTSAIEPAPPNHAGFTADQCQDCHRFVAETLVSPGEAP